MDHSVVQRWLKSVIGPYVDKDRVFADVDRTLIAISSLSPKTEVFTFNDGRTQLLVTLQGTIPVQFRNSTYNIPVAYWIPREYPRGAPMGFVVPTPDMGIRKGPNIDPSGQIGGEYLSKWGRKPEACSLLDFVHDCQHMFGLEPPVFAKPKSVAGQPNYAATSASSTPTRPTPPAASTPVAQAYGGSPRDRPPPPPPHMQSSADQAGPPHRPPKPTTSGYGDHMSSPQQSFASPSHQHSPAPSHDQYRRLSGANYGPPTSMPPSRSSSVSIAPTGPQSPQPLSAGAAPSHRPWEQQHHRMSNGHASPQPLCMPPGQSPAQRQPQFASNGSPAAPYQAHHTPQGGQQQPQRYPYHQQSPAPLSPSPQARAYKPPTGQPTPSPARPAIVNLLDDDDTTGTMLQPGSNGINSAAPPPPRPVNPELMAMHDRLFAKLDARLMALSASLDASNQQLHVLSTDLERGRPAIEDEMSRLRAVRDVCKITGDRLEETVVQARERVTALRHKEDPDPDTMVMATSIVGNQLIDLVAEDNAIGDTLYQLARALNAERIDLDRFLKQTRMLAREQFMKRALAHKISEGMGWS